ncbi:hypothetical protein PYH58_11955 [Mammaliicoccus sciuri]|uniref:hypothetical protein n=1 Tax=Mammaliicoccus sciuri TaxID=1296 RepID=UPI0033652D45
MKQYNIEIKFSGAVTETIMADSREEAEIIAEQTAIDVTPVACDDIKASISEVK